MKCLAEPTSVLARYLRARRHIYYYASRESGWVQTGRTKRRTFQNDLFLSLVLAKCNAKRRRTPNMIEPWPNLHPPPRPRLNSRSRRGSTLTYAANLVPDRPHRRLLGGLQSTPGFTYTSSRKTCRDVCSFCSLLSCSSKPGTQSNNHVGTIAPLKIYTQPYRSYT